MELFGQVEPSGPMNDERICPGRRGGGDEEWRLIATLKNDQNCAVQVILSGTMGWSSFSRRAASGGAVITLCCCLE
jgi:hypothetical protein